MHVSFGLKDGTNFHDDFSGNLTKVKKSAKYYYKTKGGIGKIYITPIEGEFGCEYCNPEKTIELC